MTRYKCNQVYKYNGATIGARSAVNYPIGNNCCATARRPVVHSMYLDSRSRDKRLQRSCGDSLYAEWKWQGGENEKFKIEVVNEIEHIKFAKKYYNEFRHEFY